MKDSDHYTDAEIAKRRDDAIRRALNTPPQPRAPSKKGQRGRPKKIAAGDGGATEGTPGRPA
jgi:hypothetical protein